MIIRSSILLISMACLSSCSVYQQGFDCEPARGVGCKSVSEIERSILEQEKGEDLFLLTASTGCKGCDQPKNAKIKGVPSSIRVERVWVSDSITPEGNQVDGHYIYFPVVDEWQSMADLKSLYKES